MRPARVEYAYDAADRLTSENQDGRAVGYEYDKADRLTHEIQDGRDVAYTYDPASNRTLIQWPDGKAAAYSYTARHQLASVSFEAVTLAAYSYDIQGRATGATFGNGNSAGVGHEVDDDLSLLAYALKDESGAAQALEWTYTYTDAHRLASQAVTVAAHDWSPPANVTTSYAAPSLAPGLPGEAANAVDQYEEVAEAVNGGAAQNSGLSYDVRGNLIADGTWVYTYDLENRMLTASASGTSCSSTCTYAYDPMGRRVSKTVGGTVTKFLRAGPAEIAEYDGSGNLLRRYVPGAGPDTFVVWIEGTGTTSASMKWILADRQGSVAVVTDNNGWAVQRFAYDPFGNETAGAPGTGFPFRYTGQRFDPETGLYYYKARYYSAKLGRFLQTDPVGYEDQLNLYIYVANDPTNNSDPSGDVTVQLSFSINVKVPKWLQRGINKVTGNKDATPVGGGSISVSIAVSAPVPIIDPDAEFDVGAGVSVSVSNPGDEGGPVGEVLAALPGLSGSATLGISTGSVVNQNDLQITASADIPLGKGAAKTAARITQALGGGAVAKGVGQVVGALTSGGVHLGATSSEDGSVRGVEFGRSMGVNIDAQVEMAKINCTARHGCGGGSR